MKALQSAAALLLCLFFVLPFAGCSREEESNAGKSFTYHLTREPSTLDPQIAQGEDAAVVINALYEGLARLDENGNAVPGAAESWESSDGFTTYTFHLKEGATWSDGKTPVTAADFVYAFQRALDPQTASSTCEPMLCLKNARAVQAGDMAVTELGVYAQDEYTLVVELEFPLEDFPVLTASPVFMPCNQEFFQGTAGRYGLNYACVLGNGPFVIDGRYGWDPGKRINLTASRTYQGTVLPSDLKLPLGSSEVDVSDPVEAVASGTVDAIALTAEEAAEAEERGCTITSFQDTVWGLCFNLSSASAPELANENVRKAFLLSLSREALLENIPSGAEAAEGAVPPAVSADGGSYREQAGPIAFPAQAEDPAALMQAGLAELGAESPPSITILCPEDPQVTAMVNSILVVWNNTFGQYFNMAPLEESALQSRVSAGDYSVALCSFQPGGNDPVALLSLFETGAAGNVTGFSLAEYDSLVEQARFQSGEEKLASCLAAETMLAERAVFLPLYYGEHCFASAPGVTGVVFRPYGGGIDFTRAGKE